MKAHTSTVLRSLLLLIVASISNSIFANDIEYKNLITKKLEVAKLYHSFRNADLEFEKTVAGRAVIENKIEILQSDIETLNKELSDYEAFPKKRVEIYKLMAQISDEITLKTEMLKIENNALLKASSNISRRSIELDNEEKKYTKAKKELNQLIKVEIDSLVFAKVTEFEKPIAITQTEKVSCSRAETPESCESRGYDNALEKIQDSKQFIKTKTVIKNFELESDSVEKLSSNRISNIKKTLVSETYDPKTRTFLIEVKVSANVKAEADQELISKLHQQLALKFNKYKYSEGESITAIENALTSGNARQSTNTISNNQVLLTGLLAQGVKLVNMEIFDDTGEDAFSIFKQMYNLSSADPQTKMMRSFLSSAVSIKAKELDARGENGTELVSKFRSMLSSLNIPVEDWTTDYLTKPRLTNLYNSQTKDERTLPHLSDKEIGRILDNVQYLIRKDMFFSPLESNAFDKVMIVLTQDKENATANELLSNIINDVSQEIIDLSEDRKFNEAKALLNLALGKIPNDKTLLSAKSKLTEIENTPVTNKRFVGGF